MITDFNYFRLPDLNLVSKEFWKMTTVSNWKKVIIDYNKTQKNYYSDPQEVNEKCKEIKEKSAARVYKKYSYSQVKDFYKEWNIIYGQLYKYFEPIWLSDENKYGPSDDGYYDLLSSMVGSGKIFVKSCINEPRKFVEMAKNNAYVENFSYMLNVRKDDYYKIKEKYDPFFRDVRKYNL